MARRRAGDALASLASVRADTPPRAVVAPADRPVPQGNPGESTSVDSAWPPPGIAPRSRLSSGTEGRTAPGADSEDPGALGVRTAGVSTPGVWTDGPPVPGACTEGTSTEGASTGGVRTGGAGADGVWTGGGAGSSGACTGDGSWTDGNWTDGNWTGGTSTGADGSVT